jgi:transposase
MVESGHTYREAALAVDVNLRTVAKWVARFRVSGWDGLRERRRGRRPREQMALSDDQQAEILALMMGSNPDQLQLPGVLWTRGALAALIEKRFKVRLSLQTVGLYLRRWDYTPKKPQKRWLEQDAERVRAWLSEEYPAIKARAKRERALLLFCDEMGVRSGQTAGRSYAPVGQRAVVKLTGKRFGANVISAIGLSGDFVFDIFEGSCDEIRFLDFLDKLLAHFSTRKVFLVLDNASFHKTPAVECWLEDHPRMELFFLPPYAPELNPTELLNNDVHAHVARRRPSTLSQLIEMTLAYLLTRTSEVVRNYFYGEHVAYTVE